jgi:hypothetical protein
MDGGADNKIIPMYEPLEIKNKMRTREEKEIYNKTADKYPPKEQMPTLDLKYYNPIPPKKAPPALPTLQQFMPIYTSLPPVQESFYNGIFPNRPQYIPPTIVNTYQIGTQGQEVLPSPDVLKSIIADTLPDKTLSKTYDTLYERLIIQKFIKTSIFNNTEGDVLNINNVDNKIGILNYMKIIDLNPYHRENVDNPYLGSQSPDKFLLFRSCYPVTKDKDNNTVCAKDSLQLNIRIYKLEETEYSAIPHAISTLNCKAWKEYDYYSYIYNNIIKNKVSPNFAIMIGWSKSDNCNISFKNNSILAGNKDDKGVKDSSNVLNQQDQNKAMILITEASTYSFIQWICIKYDSNFKMIDRADHSINEWYNMFFQLFAALYVMQKNNIYIENFSIYDNVYIKNIEMRGSEINFWKYKIDDIDYYIPNLGFIVLIDSNFNGNEIILNNKDTTKDMLAIFKSVINELINVKNNNTLTIPNREKINFELDKTIITIFDNIISSLTETKISEYISKYFHRFMHNRIGTLIKETELPNIRKENRTFKQGQLVICEEANNEYKCVLIKEITKKDDIQIVTIITKEVDGYKESTINITDIYNYSPNHNIQQTIISTEKRNDEDIIETYII